MEADVGVAGWGVEADVGVAGKGIESDVGGRWYKGLVGGGLCTTTSLLSKCCEVGVSSRSLLCKGLVGACKRAKLGCSARRSLHYDVASPQVL